MRAPPPIGVVVISRNEGCHLAATIENLERTLPANATIAVVDDGSEDGSADFLVRRRGRRVRLFRNPFLGASMGVTRARNFGAEEVKGEILVFSDAHMTYPPLWWRPLVDLLEQPGVGATAPVIVDSAGSPIRGVGLTFKNAALEVRWLKHRGRTVREVPILPGACFVIRRDVFDAAGGWDEGMLHRGNVDNEISVRLWLLGYRLLVTPEVTAGHLFRKQSPYPVGWPEYLQNRLRLPFVHFKPERISETVQALAHQSNVGAALLLIANSDAAGRRRELAERRVHDDDWFFARFGIKI